MTVFRPKSPLCGRLLPILLACLLAPGCIKNRILIKVSKDGTGKIFVTRVWSQQVAAMYAARTMSWPAHGMSEDGQPRDPFYNLPAIRAAAGEFGPGVTYIKSRKYDNAGTRGYIALYKFENINDIFVNMESLSADDVMDIDMYDAIDEDAEIEVADKEENAFQFSLVKGEMNKLTVIIPEYPAVEQISPKKLDEQADEDGDESDPMMLRNQLYSMMDDAGLEGRAALMMMSTGYTGNESQYDMAARAARGARVSLQVEVEGEQVKLQASHVDKAKERRFTLLDLDMDQAVTDKKRIKKLVALMEEADYDSPLEGLLALRKMPGMTLETNRNVTVTFK